MSSRYRVRYRTIVADDDFTSGDSISDESESSESEEETMEETAETETDDELPDEDLLPPWTEIADEESLPLAVFRSLAVSGFAFSPIAARPQKSWFQSPVDSARKSSASPVEPGALMVLTGNTPSSFLGSFLEPHKF